MTIRRTCATLAAFAAMTALPAAELVLPRPPATLEVPIASPLVEPRVAVSPADPRRVVIAAIAAPVVDDDPWDCAVLASGDGGASWTATRIGVDRCIDPWPVFTGAGNVLFAGIGIARDGEGDERLRLWLSRSTDAGRSFGTPREAGRNYEHPLGIAAADGSGDVLWLARRGRLQDGRPRHALEFGRVPAGSLDYEVTATVRPVFDRLIGTALLRSPGDRPYATYNAHNEDATTCSHARGFFAGDDGAHAAIGECCAGPESARSEFAGYPYAAAGGVTLYHVCIAAGHRGVLFTRSADGERWDAGRRVDGGDADAFALTPMLAANGAGDVVVAWQDRFADPACQRLAIAASNDRGERFSRPRYLDDSPSCPASPANGRAGRSWPGGGDYSSIATDADGRFHVAWAATDAGGRYRLRYAVVEVR